MWFVKRKSYSYEIKRCLQGTDTFARIAYHRTLSLSSVPVCAEGLASAFASLDMMRRTKHDISVGLKLYVHD